MIYTFLFTFPLLAIPAGACEGQCIVDITQAFISNYSVPVQHVFADAAANLARLIPSHSKASAAKLMEPLLDAYERGAYDAMENAIFPSYFHGKCQVNGVDPAGCPNPDCPVVCGTPGSLVHFYNVLKEIAFNVTAANLINLCAPSSKAYQTLETAVLHQARTGAPSRRSLRSTHIASRLAPYGSVRNMESAPTGRLQKRGGISEAHAKMLLKSVCQGTAKDLASECGGKASLPDCSWEQEMKVRGRVQGLLPITPR